MRLEDRLLLGLQVGSEVAGEFEDEDGAVVVTDSNDGLLGVEGQVGRLRVLVQEEGSHSGVLRFGQIKHTNLEEKE
jgi:hypothetical protein